MDEWRKRCEILQIKSSKEYFCINIYAAVLRTRNSALCPVAERTRISRSVEIPFVLPFAMEVTLVRDVPAFFAISVWVIFPLRMICASAHVRSERNSILPVSALDKPRAFPNSSAVSIRMDLSEFFFLIQHLLQSLTRQTDLTQWSFLRLLLESMKNDDRLRSADIVENAYG